MLPRRHIRIKVFQSLYSYSQQKGQSPIKEEFEKNLIAYTELYYLIIYLLLLLKKVAEEEIKIKKTNLRPTKEDLNPNEKFVKNKILKKINLNTFKVQKFENEKIKSVVKSIFQKIKKSKEYIKYMTSSKTEKEDEKYIIIQILKNHVISSEKIHDFIEEYSIYWNDDLLIVYNMILEKLTNNLSLNNINLFRKKDDEDFANELLKITIEKEDEISKKIYQLVKNWDKERIAISDLIIMRMAIAEMIYIKTIPPRVTLDEYIEISKEYSGPKSKEFINGILNNIMKDN